MSKVKRKYEHVRVWLDPKNPNSMSYASRTEEEYMEKGEQSICIADCNRHINLTLHDAKDERKIRKLVNLLTDALILYNRHNS